MNLPIAYKVFRIQNRQPIPLHPARFCTPPAFQMKVWNDKPAGWGPFSVYRSLERAREVAWAHHASLRVSVVVAEVEYDPWTDYPEQWMSINGQTVFRRAPILEEEALARSIYLKKIHSQWIVPPESPVPTR